MDAYQAWSCYVVSDSFWLHFQYLNILQRTLLLGWASVQQSVFVWDSILIGQYVLFMFFSFTIWYHLHTRVTFHLICYCRYYFMAILYSMVVFFWRMYFSGSCLELFKIGILNQMFGPGLTLAIVLIVSKPSGNLNSSVLSSTGILLVVLLRLNLHGTFTSFPAGMIVVLMLPVYLHSTIMCWWD